MGTEATELSIPSIYFQIWHLFPTISMIFMQNKKKLLKHLRKCGQQITYKYVKFLAAKNTVQKQ